MIDLKFDDEAKKAHETNTMFTNHGWPDIIFLVPDFEPGSLDDLGIGWWASVISHETLHVVINHFDVDASHALDDLYQGKSWS